MRAIAFFWAIDYSSAVPLLRNFSRASSKPVDESFKERDNRPDDRVQEFPDHRYDFGPETSWDRHQEQESDRNRIGPYTDETVPQMWKVF